MRARGEGTSWQQAQFARLNMDGCVSCKPLSLHHSKVSARSELQRPARSSVPSPEQEGKEPVPPSKDALNALKSDVWGCHWVAHTAVVPVARVCLGLGCSRKTGGERMPVCELPNWPCTHKCHDPCLSCDPSIQL